MKNILYILILFCFSATGQTFVSHNDSTFYKWNGDSVFINNWSIYKTQIQIKQLLSTKGTSNFDGAYNSLSSKPDLTLKVNVSDTSGKWAAAVHTHAFSAITSPPTTVSGYGITDAPKIVAAINLTAQAANIGTTTLYAVPSAGFYRVSIYITVTQAATTSSTMPSTTIAYTDGNSGTNAHSTTTTATNTGNSLTTSFAQTTYVLYAKTSTNITYATGSYASSGGTAMNYALRIRVEAL